MKLLEYIKKETSAVGRKGKCLRTLSKTLQNDNQKETHSFEKVLRTGARIASSN